MAKKFSVGSRDLQTEQSNNRDSGMMGGLLSLLLGAIAGGLAWGIRGQYGHESGAMIFGVLVGFALCLHLTAWRLSGSVGSMLQVARAVSLFAVGVSIGGCMTYGQTVGLTHDAELVGNHAAWRWGMLGLAIKGGVWIGLGGTMFGIGLSRVRYSFSELASVLLMMAVAGWVGFAWLNQPYNPAERVLPWIYFSDDWHWQPDTTLKPRFEAWGGLLGMLVALLAAVGWLKRDRLAWQLGCWGVVGGAIGFPLGQSVQAYHAWHADWFANHAWSDFFGLVNWWNMMETVFGCVAGGVMGWGVWWHREQIGGSVPGANRFDAAAAAEPANTIAARFETPDRPSQTATSGTAVSETAVSGTTAARNTAWWTLELVTVGIHVVLLMMWNFGSFDWLDMFADRALPMVVIPLIFVGTGRLWPFLMSLPIVMLPICGKTVRRLVVEEQQIAPAWGWTLYFVLPILITLATSLWFARRSARSENRSLPKESHTKHRDAIGFGACGLLLSTAIYFALNFAFFDYPWPWQQWTARTPNAILFAIFAAGLGLYAAVSGWRVLSDRLD